MPHEDTHLRPERLGARAAGETLSSHEVAHLARCRRCQRQAAAAEATLSRLGAPELDEVSSRRMELALLTKAARLPRPPQERPSQPLRMALGAGIILGLLGWGLVGGLAPATDPEVGHLDGAPASPSSLATSSDPLIPGTRSFQGQTPALEAEAQAWASLDGAEPMGWDSLGESDGPRWTAAERPGRSRAEAPRLGAAVPRAQRAASLAPEALQAPHPLDPLEPAPSPAPGPADEEAGSERSARGAPADARAKREPKTAYAPAAAPTATVAWGETTVVRRPPEDPFAASLLEGAAAHARGRHDAADVLGLQALALAETRTQRLSAWQLVCESRIAAGRPRAAVDACTRLLAHPNPERVRTTHFMLGTLYRARLGDCARAVEHYGRALVFGVPSLYTQEALRFRAECALELGRYEQAEADLRRLEAQPGLVSRWEEVETLRAKLDRAREAASRTAPVR